MFTSIVSLHSSVSLVRDRAPSGDQGRGPPDEAPSRQRVFMLSGRQGETTNSKTKVNFELGKVKTK